MQTAGWAMVGIVAAVVTLVVLLGVPAVAGAQHPSRYAFGTGPGAPSQVGWERPVVVKNCGPLLNANECIHHEVVGNAFPGACAEPGRWCSPTPGPGSDRIVIGPLASAAGSVGAAPWMSGGAGSPTGSLGPR